jgi:hypothetical protein
MHIHICIYILIYIYAYIGTWGALNSAPEPTLETVEKAPKKPTIVIVDTSEEIPKVYINIFHRYTYQEGQMYPLTS